LGRIPVDIQHAPHAEIQRRDDNDRRQRPGYSAASEMDEQRHGRDQRSARGSARRPLECVIAEGEQACVQRNRRDHPEGGRNPEDRRRAGGRGAAPLGDRQQILERYGRENHERELYEDNVARRRAERPQDRQMGQEETDPAIPPERENEGERRKHRGRRDKTASLWKSRSAEPYPGERHSQQGPRVKTKLVKPSLAAGRTPSKEIGRP
jgi:hypothetical protein